MLQGTLVRRSVAGAAVASAMYKGAVRTPRWMHSTHNPYFTMRPRHGKSASSAPSSSAVSSAPPPAVKAPTPSETRLKEFKRFYETVTRSREATSLPPTLLGHGGSERILNNDLLHESPWQASCVELRERAIEEEEKKVLSYDNIDFASLRRHGSRRYAGGPNTSSGRSGAASSYSNVEDMQPKGAPQQGPGLDVVHYYETSMPAGLAGYQRVAMQVRKGVLPGSCTNFSAEGGFAVWVVPHHEYARAMSALGLLPK